MTKLFVLFVFCEKLNGCRCYLSDEEKYLFICFMLAVIINCLKCQRSLQSIFYFTKDIGNWWRYFRLWNWPSESVVLGVICQTKRNVYSSTLYWNHYKLFQTLGIDLFSIWRRILRVDENIFICGKEIQWLWKLLVRQRRALELMRNCSDIFANCYRRWCC